jgi:hypothetical protein
MLAAAIAPEEATPNLIEALVVAAQADVITIPLCGKQQNGSCSQGDKCQCKAS